MTNPRAANIRDLHTSDCYDTRSNVPRGLSIRWRVHNDNSHTIHFDPDDPKVVV